MKADVKREVATFRTEITPQQEQSGMGFPASGREQGETRVRGITWASCLKDA